ncbi:MAG: ATP-binding protein [Streptosporangiaceae bacterium]
MRLLAIIRAVILCQAVSALALHWHATRDPGVIAGVLALLLLDNVVLVARMRDDTRDPRGPAVLDVALGMAGLVVAVALLKPTANPDTDNILYPYTVTTLFVIGLAYRRLGPSLTAAALATAVYVTSTGWRFGLGSVATMLANATTYWAWAVGGWLVADRFRRLSEELDQARRIAAAREAELAAERERSRHARELHSVRMAAASRELDRARERARLSRALHDHVLQTLEFMGRDGWISDPVVRDQVAAEAAWLRDLVRGELDPGEGALCAALERVAQRQTRAGLRIELNTSGLGAAPLAAQAVAALAGAVGELLTNVRKHAGTDRAVVRAVLARDQVVVTVLDHGRGFDPIKVTGGVGLRESVIARVRETGGHVVVTSEPGTGTHVEITIPVLGEPASPAPAAPPPDDVPQTQDVPAGPGPTRMLT